ncbi:MAG: transcription antitermination factor NusB [Bilophila sp.]
MSKSRPHARRAARSRAFQVLYSLHFSPTTTLGDLRSAFTAMPDPTDADMDENAEVEPATSAPAGFSWELVEGVWANVATLDTVIERFSQNWRVDRLGKIELTLLRLAVFEMLYRPDVPPKVAINEALELSTRFGDAKAKSFINGILDATAKAQEAGELPVAGKPGA